DWPRMALAKSPGSIATAAKMTIETMKSVSRPSPSRCNAVFKTGFTGLTLPESTPATRPAQTERCATGKDPAGPPRSRRSAVAPGQRRSQPAPFGDHVVVQSRSDATTRVESVPQDHV